MPSLDWCNWKWQTDLTLFRGFFGQNPPSANVFPYLVRLRGTCGVLCIFFSFQRFAHWNWNQEKKLPWIIKVSLWTFTFYLPPPFSRWKDHIWCSFFPALNLSDIYITFADLSLASWINNLPGRGEQKQFCLGSIPDDKTIFIFHKATKTQIPNTQFKEIFLPEIFPYSWNSTKAQRLYVGIFLENPFFSHKEPLQPLW